MFLSVRFLIIITLLALLSSCATNIKPGPSVSEYKTELPLIHLNVKDVASIEVELKELVKLANNKGPSTISLLVDDLFVKASDASLRGEGELALLFFKYAHILMPQELYIHEKFAFELVKSGQLQLAQEEMLKLVSQDSKYEKWQMVLAGVYSAMEQYPAAEKIYKIILADNKGHESACISLNGLYTEQQKFSKSARLLDRCRKASVDKKQKLNFLFYKAKNWIQNGKKPQAIKLLRRIVKRDVMFHEAWLTLGLLYEEDEKLDKAQAVYAKAIKVGNDDYLILSRLTNILIFNGNVKDAIPYLTRLVDMEPDNLNALVKLGIAHSDAKQLQAAKDIFKKILSQVPDSDKVLYYLGVLSIEMGEFEESLDYFARIPSESQFFLDGHLQMANVLISLGESTKKSVVIDKIKATIVGFLKLGLDSEQYQMQLSLKLISYLESKNRFKQAISFFNNLKTSSLFTVDHDYYLASLYERDADRIKARDIMLDIIKKDPKNAQAYNFYGYSLLEEGTEIAKAYQYISKAVELSPEDAYIRDSLGWYYFTVKKYDKALQELKVAYKLFEKEPTILQHLAQVYGELNKLDLARKFYTEALKSSTTEQEKDKLLEQMRNFGIKPAQVRLPASEQ